MGLKQRQKILGLPIGPKQFSWAKLASLIVGALAAVAALVVGRDIITHSPGRGGDGGSGSESESDSEQS